MKNIVRAIYAFVAVLSALALAPKCAQAAATSTEYVSIEYLQSQGAQWINTKFVPTVTMKIEVSYELTVAVSGDNREYVFGAYGSGNGVTTWGRAQFAHMANNKLFVSWCGEYNDNVGTATEIGALNRRRTVTLDRGYFTTSDNVYSIAYTGTNMGSTSAPVYLFACNQNAASTVDARYLSKGMRIYSAKIWDNDVLVRDYIPVRRVSDGALGMLDRVSHEFVGNGGSGEFLAGPDQPLAHSFLMSMVVEGAEISTVGDDLLLTFKTNGFLTLPGIAQARMLAVGGGGAGGSGAIATTLGSGGGGGAGGFVEVPSRTYGAGTYTIEVGKGGEAAADNATVVSGGKGGDTSVSGPTNIVAVGGGGGGARAELATAGGSGGGASRAVTSGTTVGAAGTEYQGNAGGDSGYNQAAGGGGGAGSPGSPSTASRISGDGGIGMTSDISGAEVYYAGGGGGGARSGTNSTGGNGGLGGGGDGGDGSRVATAGQDGLGGGGGGCSNNAPGGRGGDGIVIIRISAMLDGPIVKPTAEEIPYDGFEHVKFETCDLAYTIDPVSTLAATTAGTYRVKVTMNEGFTWSDGSADPVDITWSIVQAANVIQSFTLANWKEGVPNDPVLVADFGVDTAVYTYEGLTKDGESYGPTAERPNLPGNYTVAVEIPPTANYVGASAGPVAFTIIPGETSPIPELGRFAEISASNYTGTATLTNFPMLIKVSEDLIPGFRYAQAAADGSDVRFSTPAGDSFDFEIDEWNPGGTSLIWVRVPEFTKDTTVVMCWGQVAGQELAPVDPRGTWKDFAGVWHMGEQSGTAFNSAPTGSAYNGVPSGTYSQDMVGADGIVGTSRVNLIDRDEKAGSNGTRMIIPNYDALHLGGVFTLSGWFKAQSRTGYPRPFSRKNAHGDANGWEIQVNNSDTDLEARGASDTLVSYKVPYKIYQDWWLLTLVYSNNMVIAYINGEKKNQGAITPATDNGKPMAIGNNSNGSEQAFRGWYDEVRLTGEILSPDWIKADYDQIKNDIWVADIAGKTKDVVLVNRWANEPKIEPSVWDVGTLPDTFDKGADSAGATPTVVYRNLQTGEIVTNTMPTASGRYEATFVIEASAAYDGIQKTIPFEILSNRWVAEPTITTRWKEGEEPEIFRGADVRGPIDDERGDTAYIVYRDCSADTYVTNALPTAPGSYTAIFVVEAVTVDGVDYGRIEKAMDFNITTESPYGDADGAQGANGRVLLMNRDLLAGSVVEYQGYYDNATRYAATGTTFWQYVNEDAVTGFNLQKGTEFILWTKNYGAKLWHLYDCRHGNTFPTSVSDPLQGGQVYLPWSTTSRRITYHNNQAITRSTVGQCVMRNTPDAGVYSSCFTNGIGTIYFDAANAWTATGDAAANYRIAVEIATNCLNAAGEPIDREPTDENVLEILAAHWEPVDAEDPENVNSNWVAAVTNEYGFANWQPVNLEVLKRDYPSDFEGEMTFQKLAYGVETAMNEFQACGMTATNICLSIANGGTFNNFYRIYVPLNYHGPIRFRIVRQSVDSGYVHYPDDGGLILLDNIIASYPQMRADLSAYGIFDEAKVAKQVLGQEAAWETPFPTAGADDVLARAKVEYYTNAGDPTADTNDFIVAAKLNYRWRYLDQQFGDWKSVFLDKTSGMKAHLPLELPEVPGDVEYFFELQLNAPFYEYVDYSGTDLKLGDFYTEALPIVTNRRDAAASPQLPSCGTDWFVRLREGKSDVEQAKLIVRRGAADAEGTELVIPMELVDNHVWRGYFQTRTNDLSAAYYRIELLNRQTPGAEDWEENSTVYYTTTTNSGGIVNGKLDVVGSDADWSWTEVDAATGYLMFQMDDETRAITIVHADYQNFNAWTDAKGKLFVGTSVEDETKVGTSQNKRDFVEDFDTWSSMSATNAHWTVPTFADLDSLLGRQSYTTFVNDSDNNWEIGQGMWVSKYYAEHPKLKDSKAKDKGVALQMEGQGKGYIQFTDATDCPRGIESVSFNARLGQSVKFSDFAYYDAAVKTTMTNYTFVTRCAFDLNQNLNFSGNASLSLIARYRPSKGCYEARWEQLGAAWDNSGNVTGPKANLQRLCLYRWTRQSDGAVKPVLLTAMTNTTFSIPQASALNGTEKFLPFFITVSNINENAVWIMAGVKQEKNGSVNGMSLDPLLNSAGLSTYVKDNKRWFGVCYQDTTGDAHKNGTYGVLSANCEGVFGTPVCYSAAIPHDPSVLALPAANTGNKSVFSGKQINFPADTLATECHVDLKNERWEMVGGRMMADVESGSTYLRCIRAADVTQKIKIFTAPAGKTTWTQVAEKEITGFGNAGSTANCSFNLWQTRDRSIRIAVDDTKTIDDTRVDIVIDSVVLKQWRGTDYDTDEVSSLIPEWNPQTSIAMIRTNFMFTSCWIQSATKGSGSTATTEGNILMSARRTTPGTPCAIVSPLMDGTYGRGKGLGMFSFSYKNAQPNVRLLLQVATNVTYLATESIDNLDPAMWTTVTNFTFTGTRANSSVEQICSCYIGMHDVQGIMRLVMDPELVESVEGVSNPAQFGDILITKVFCRDEPALDSGSWWGWNIRTLGMDSLGLDDEGRMYLPDYSTDPARLGLSIAANNSIIQDIDREDAETYRQNKPFIQTPTFTSDVVGEVAFRARKYDALSTQPAAVMLYGSRTGDGADEWVALNDGKPFVISNATYSTYKYKTDPGQAYKAFRLCVNGVDGVTGAGSVQPEGYTDPVRVLIDEVVVSEAVRARVAFRNVGAFRSQLRERNYVPNVPSAAEQPLCNEGWGVQCEVYAAQLADDINFDIEPMVYLHWYEGTSPWGYENWCSNSLAKTVRLPPATDTNLIFRSTYLGNYADSVIPMSTVPGTTIQYTLEVRYWQKGSAVAMTNFLSDADWVRPEWYRPLDFNRDYGHGQSFAAYNILDTVAPGWAWINEANILGSYDSVWNNSEARSQFVEIAVPQEADIQGWYVNLIGASMWDGMVITNRIGEFGTTDLPGMKKDGGLYAASGMVFRVLGSLMSSAVWGGKLDPKNGELDATWDFQYTSDTFLLSGEIFGTDPLGIQLVRASGIIEHEVLGIGTNYYGSFPGLEQYYDPTLTAEFLNETMRESRFFYVGQDSAGDGKSLGVFTSRGENADTWNNTMQMTPGRINQNQSINPEHPTPNGETIIVYANIDNTFGHIVQSVGDVVETNAAAMVFITRGSVVGTNITYRVDPWYELGSVTATVKGKSTSAPFGPVAGQARTYVATVGVGASNNVTVVARAKLADKLVNEFGLDENNRYTPAVVDWLEHGCSLRGEWENAEDGEIYLADFVGLSGAVVTNMTLTEMYWLDMDPTISNQAFVAGMAVPPMPLERPVEGYMGTSALTNLKMGVFMMITNRSTDVADTRHYGKAWTPYVLRGLAPGENSLDFDNSTWGWTSVTFKVTGILANGLTGEQNPGDWVPLRWFVFHEDSFPPLDSAVDPGITRIEVKDPFSTESPGYAAGWNRWLRIHGYAPVFFSWALDERITPIAAEILEQQNYYDTP